LITQIKEEITQIRISLDYGTVAKYLFVIVRIEVDNWYLFIVHGLRFRLRISLILGFVHRFFLRDLLRFTINDT